MDVIFLNGASSSGKSTIAKQLQSLMPDYYLHIGIDSFIAMMPEKTNTLNHLNSVSDGFYWREALIDGKKVSRISAGKYGKSVNYAYRIAVKSLIDSGLKVIVDDVVDGNDELMIWRELLADTRCVFIGVKCDEQSLINREQQRENRHNGSAIEQARRVHEGINYDFIVDTTQCSSRQCAEAIQCYLSDWGA